MARMQRVESRAIHAYSYNARRRRLTLRFEPDGSTYRYALGSTPPDHDGSACPVCTQGAAAIAAAFAAAPSKGTYYNAVLRRGHFVTQRAPNWRRRGRTRPLPAAVASPDPCPDPLPLQPSPRDGTGWASLDAGRSAARLAATGPTVPHPPESQSRPWRGMLDGAATRGIAALILLGILAGAAGPVRGATPTGTPTTSTTPSDPCPHYGAHGLAPVSDGSTGSGHATSTASATTRLCVAASAQVVGPATGGPSTPMVAVLSQASSALTVYVGRASDPAIRALLPPGFASGSAWGVIVSDL